MDEHALNVSETSYQLHIHVYVSVWMFLKATLTRPKCTTMEKV